MKHIFLALSQWARLMAMPPFRSWDSNRCFFHHLNYYWFELNNQEYTPCLANAPDGDWYWEVCPPSIDPLDKGTWTDYAIDEDPAMW